MRGIGVVNLVHTSGEEGEHYPIDFRIYAKAADGKTKNDHFQEMLLRAVSDKQVQAKTLFDSWYGLAGFDSSRFGTTNGFDCQAQESAVQSEIVQASCHERRR